MFFGPEFTYQNIYDSKKTSTLDSWLMAHNYPEKESLLVSNLIHEIELPISNNIDINCNGKLYSLFLFKKFNFAGDHVVKRIENFWRYNIERFSSINFREFLQHVRIFTYHFDDGYTYRELFHEMRNNQHALGHEIYLNQHEAIEQLIAELDKHFEETKGFNNPTSLENHIPSLG